MSNEVNGKNGHVPYDASRPTLYTPPPAAGSPPMHQPPPGPTGTLHSASAPPPPPTTQQNGTYQGQDAVMAAVAAVMQMQQTQYSSPFHNQLQIPVPQASDDNTLAQIIFEQTARGFSYKAALESLHGHNGIAAFAWKDYYLENKPRIDAIVVAIRARNLPSSIKTERETPTPVNDDQHVRKKARQSETPARSISGDINPNSKKKPQASASSSNTKSRVAKVKKDVTPKESDRASSVSRRRTLNSLASTPGAGFLATVPTGVAIDANTGLPAAPSRSPSPPLADTNNSDHRGIRRFTEADARFFYKRIAYDLARDPELTKGDLCELLAEKAPNHTSLSWRTYWTRHEDVADKMLLLTELDDEDRVEVIRSWKAGVSITANESLSPQKLKRPNYAESSDSQSAKSASEESDGHYDDDDGIGSTDEDEELGEAGSTFTNAESRVLAKYIATKSNWLKTGKMDWADFYPMYPKRTPASWREFYRRKRKDIDKLARKYFKREEERQRVVIKQRGRPSWAVRKGSISEGKQKLDDDRI